MGKTQQYCAFSEKRRSENSNRYYRSSIIHISRSISVKIQLNIIFHSPILLMPNFRKFTSKNFHEFVSTIDSHMLKIFTHVWQHQTTCLHRTILITSYP